MSPGVNFINILHLRAKILKTQKRQSSQQCRFVLLGPTSIKAAHKMLTKLTPGVNFNDILRSNFSYERRFGSFFYLHVTRESCRNDIRTKIAHV